MKCEFFIRKTGGYYYGFKCSLYHGGYFPLYSNGTSIEFGIRGESDGMYDKNLRDMYVDNVCKKDCTKCTMYNSHKGSDNIK